MTISPDFNRLPILCSSRIRLTQDQRKVLKDAYFSQRKNANDENTSGGLRVTTSIQSDVERELGLSHLVLLDILNTRDTINTPLILQLQKALGVEIVTRSQLENAFKSYLDWVLNK